MVSQLNDEIPCAVHNLETYPSLAISLIVAFLVKIESRATRIPSRII